MFLTDAQLKKLTGRTQAAAQCRWLKRNGIRHFRNRLGKVVVTQAALEGRPAKEQHVGPDLGWIKHAA